LSTATGSQLCGNLGGHSGRKPLVAFLAHMTTIISEQGSVRRLEQPREVPEEVALTLERLAGLAQERVPLSIRMKSLRRSINC
jgi:hypothetical protein